MQTYKIFLNTTTLLVLFIAIRYSNACFAQIANSSFLLQAGFKQGTIWKHTPNFEPTITEQSTLFEVAVVKQTKGNKVWHQLHHNPQIGLSFIYAKFGDETIFGHGLGLMPNIGFIHKKKYFDLITRIGVGLSYLNKPFHRIYNPTNNVIGSHINNITMLMFALAWKPSSNLQLQANFSFTHFSNGKVKLPNLGINVPAIGATFTYLPKVKNNIEITHIDSIPKVDKKIHFGLHTGIGFNEYDRPNGPRYMVYVVSPYLFKRLNTKSQLLLGLDANHYRGLFYFIENQVALPDKHFISASKLAPYIGYELFFNHISLTVQTGYYVYAPYMLVEPVMAKLGIQFYAFPTYLKTKHQLYGGIFLKAHYSKADYVELAIGTTF